MTKIVDLVVTRHPALLEVLVAEGIATPGTPVIAHATPEAVRGKNVAGVLPLHLAAEAASITEVTLHLPAELRGQELTAEQVRSHMKGIRTFKVEVVE